ncbi:MAG: UDP-N-acetylmuramoyl-tripeptide--D-alanyl-D-alanine ligase [Leptospirales bacterium]
MNHKKGKEWLTIGEILETTQSRWSGPPLPPETVLYGAVTDTREMVPGTLFIAIEGERFDGHEFVSEAFSKGAVAALVSREIPGAGPQLVVPDSLKGLQGIARAVLHRRFGEGKKLVSLTGTAGKTTTRELLRLVLGGEGGRVHSNRLNWNNEIGVPRTLWEWPPDAPEAVLEVGIRKPGDMEFLGPVLVSDVVIITSIGEGHLETLGSVHGVWQEKSRLLAYLRPGGTVVLPLEIFERFGRDSFFQKQDLKILFVTLTLPETNPDSVFLSTPPSGSSVLEGHVKVDGTGGWHLSGRWGTEDFECLLPSPSSPLAMDALLALAAGRALGIPLSEGAARVQLFHSLPGRMEISRTPEGALLLLDHYNANPVSMTGAFDWAFQVWKKECERKGQDVPGKLLAVLGDMLELGDESAHLHREIGTEASCFPFSGIFYKGVFAGEFLEGFERGGGSPSIVQNLPLAEPLSSDIFPSLASGDVVLIKGSRGMHLEREASFLAEGR